MTIRSLTLATGAAAALAFAGASPAFAQPAQQAPAMPQQDIGEVSDAEIDQFASATMRVDQVVQEWNTRLEAAEEAEQADMQAQAQEDLAAAVEAEGLSVERYNQMAMAAQTDAELASRISAQMQ